MDVEPKIKFECIMRPAAGNGDNRRCRDGIADQVNNDAAAPALGPKAMPMNVTNDPVLGLYFENSASVLLRKRIATIATMMVSGAATPAPATITPKPK